MITGTKTEIKNQLNISPRSVTNPLEVGDRFEIHSIDMQLNSILNTPSSNNTGTIFYGVVTNTKDSLDMEVRSENVTILLGNSDVDPVKENFIDELAKQSEQMEYPKFWLREFDKEVRRLFGEKLPTSYNLNEIDVMLEHTPEEAAAHFFSGYTIL